MVRCKRSHYSSAWQGQQKQAAVRTARDAGKRHAACACTCWNCKAAESLHSHHGNQPQSFCRFNKHVHSKVQWNMLQHYESLNACGVS
jgi:hypothetical protein